MQFATLSRTRLAAAAAAACAAAAIPAVAAASSSSAPARAAAARKCATSGLVVWLDTTGNGAAGSSVYALELTNLSGRTCTLTGYPGVSGVDLRGRQLGSSAKRTSPPKATTVTLAPGASALTALRIVDVGVFTPSTCRPVTAAGLRVYPPNQTASKIVPFPFPACSRRGVGYLSVQPVRHG
jgi:hypothetical protein